MSLNALLLPVDGQPVVVRDRGWGLAAIAELLGTPSARAVPLDWSPDDGYALVLLAAGTDPPNKAAHALGGWLAQGLGGDLLLIGVTSEMHPVSIDLEHLLVIATRLLVAEAVAGELG